MDIHFSFFFKTSGYRVLTTPQVAERIERHPHREWLSLSEEERATKSKKNYDIVRGRWHHGESLLEATYNLENLSRAHEHPFHLDLTDIDSTQQLTTAGTMHTHTNHDSPE